jgi:hypothetical protein
MAREQFFVMLHEGARALQLSYAEGKTTYRELTLELGHGGLNDFED